MSEVHFHTILLLACSPPVFSAVHVRKGLDSFKLISLEDDCRDGIDMEYKYVIRGPDGHVTWNPGSNYNIALQGEGSAEWLQMAVAIRDAWDGASRCIEVSSCHLHLKASSHTAHQTLLCSSIHKRTQQGM